MTLFLAFVLIIFYPRYPSAIVQWVELATGLGMIMGGTRSLHRAIGELL